jgi:hypothetical protein
VGHWECSSPTEPCLGIGWDDSVLRFARYGYPARLEAARCTAAGLITGSNNANVQMRPFMRNHPMELPVQLRGDFPASPSSQKKRKT